MTDSARAALGRSARLAAGLVVADRVCATGAVALEWDFFSVPYVITIFAVPLALSWFVLRSRHALEITRLGTVAGVVAAMTSTFVAPAWIALAAWLAVAANRAGSRRGVLTAAGMALTVVVLLAAGLASEEPRDAAWWVAWAAYMVNGVLCAATLLLVERGLLEA